MNETYSFGKIIEKMSIESAKELETRTYERYFSNILSKLDINEKILKNGKKKYEIPEKYVPFIIFLLEEASSKGNYISKLASPKEIDISYQDIILFYHHLLVWVKNQLKINLNKTESSEQKQKFIEKIFDTLPDEMLNEKIYVIALEDELFRLDVDDEIYSLFDSVVCVDNSSMNMEELISLLDFVKDCIGYNQAYFKCMLHAQLDEIITQYFIVNSIPDEEDLEDSVGKLSLIQFIQTLQVMNHIQFYEEINLDLKGSQKELDFYIDVYHGLEKEPNDEEDEFFEPLTSIWDALNRCKELHLQKEYNKLIVDYKQNNSNISELLSKRKK